MNHDLGTVRCRWFFPHFVSCTLCPLGMDGCSMCHVSRLYPFFQLSFGMQISWLNVLDLSFQGIRFWFPQSSTGNLKMRSFPVAGFQKLLIFQQHSKINTAKCQTNWWFYEKRINNTFVIPFHTARTPERSSSF